MVASLDAHRFLRASMQLCSWQSGWRSLLLREYDDDPCADTFTTAATPDYFLCLVTAGSCKIEEKSEGRWRLATHQVGNLAFRPPGAASTLRWTSHERHRTLQLYVPAMFFEDAAASLRGRHVGQISLAPMRFFHDPLTLAVISALREAMVRGAPDMYAETAAQLLAAHTLQLHQGMSCDRTMAHDDKRLRRADDHLRSSLAQSVSLSSLAHVAGISRFHLLRLFKSAYGETPLRRLTRMRMDEARRLLGRSNLSVTEIGLRCGYDNPANFAAAFRRHVGTSPSAYRCL